jgi:xanthine dehydrogenase accessory factor
MTLPDFASVIPTLRSKRGTGEAAVIVTIIGNNSQLDLHASERIVVAEDGTVSGLFPAPVLEQLRTDALACLAQMRSRLLSYRVLDSGPVPAGIQQGDLDVYFEVLETTPRLIVVGGGHIAVPLVRVSKILGYEVIVLDDRAEYASPERFPEADTVLLGPYNDTLAGVPIDANTYIVLVTRGHVHDAACLEQVIHSPAAYIGMIGSKKRVRTVIDHVLGLEHSPQDLQRVHAPIGLDIGSKTPAEIAVAIAAELVKVRRGGLARSLTMQTRPHV